ncbi:MAG: DUF2934 domain-containing protein [Spirochaetales bacterium]|nr:DUF2934 domain-containing protein [Spirochaetales bacterium]
MPKTKTTNSKRTTKTTKINVKTTAMKKVAKKESFWDEVRERSYYIYLDRVKANSIGDSLSDWVKAEKEIQAKYN